jgi:hypothetical protein
MTDGQPASLSSARSYLWWSDGLEDTFLKGSVFHFRGNSLPMYTSRERVYNCHPDNDAFAALIVAEK